MRERVQGAARSGCELALELIVAGVPDDDVEEFERSRLRSVRRHVRLTASLS